MTYNELTSRRVASIAARGLDSPLSLTADEIRTVCASALTQAPDHNPPPGAHGFYNALTRARAYSSVAASLAAVPPRNALAGDNSLAKLLADDMGFDFEVTKRSA
jgi:hypothetical protein